MRKIAAVMAFVGAALTPGAALADVRVTYRETQSGTMVVEAADNGASRAEMTAPPEAASLGITGPLLSFSTPEGELFLVIPTARRTLTVNLADVVAVLNELTERYIPANLPVPPELTQFRLRQVGEETVAGRRGRRYVFDFPLPPAGEGAAAAPAPPPMDFVVSNDADLLPVVRAFAPGLNMFRELALFRRLGTPVFDQMAAVFGEGAVLRAGTDLVLTNVEQVTVDPERYRVPGTPMTRDEIRALAETFIGAMQAEAAAANAQRGGGTRTSKPRPAAPPPPPRK